MATGRPKGRPALVASAPHPNAEIPPYPVSLNTEYSKNNWDRIWLASDTLEPFQDYVTVEMICISLQEISRMRTILKGKKPDPVSGGIMANDLIWINGNSNLVSHPYVKQVNELTTKVTSWLSSLGFTPVDRAKMDILKDMTEDPVLALSERIMKRRASKNE